MKIATHRIYQSNHTGNGVRILVDRVWPRGLSKEKAAIDYWAKEVAPSTELRKWFGHDPNKWPEFKKRYFAELDNNPESCRELLSRIEGKNALLLYGAKDEHHNNAVALKEYLKKRF